MKSKLLVQGPERTWVLVFASSQTGTNPMFSSFMMRAQSRTESSGLQHVAELITSSTRMVPLLPGIL